MNYSSKLERAIPCTWPMLFSAKENFRIANFSWKSKSENSHPNSKNTEGASSSTNISVTGCSTIPKETWKSLKITSGKVSVSIRKNPKATFTLVCSS